MPEYTKQQSDAMRASLERVVQGTQMVSRGASSTLVAGAVGVTCGLCEAYGCGDSEESAKRGMKHAEHCPVAVLAELALTHYKIHIEFEDTDGMLSLGMSLHPDDNPRTRVLMVVGEWGVFRRVTRACYMQGDTVAYLHEHEIRKAITDEHRSQNDD